MDEDSEVMSTDSDFEFSRYGLEEVLDSVDKIFGDDEEIMIPKPTGGVTTSVIGFAPVSSVSVPATIPHPTTKEKTMKKISWYDPFSSDERGAMIGPKHRASASLKDPKEQEAIKKALATIETFFFGTPYMAKISDHDIHGVAGASTRVVNAAQAEYKVNGRFGPATGPWKLIDHVTADIGYNNALFASRTSFAPFGVLPGARVLNTSIVSPNDVTGEMSGGDDEGFFRNVLPGDIDLARCMWAVYTGTWLSLIHI